MDLYETKGMIVVMKILFMGQYYTDSQRRMLFKICKNGISEAHHKFQKRIIEGISNTENIELITTLPVGNYPKRCKRIFFKSHRISNNHFNVGFINLPLIKHKIREKIFYKETNTWVNAIESEEPIVILIYDLYIPILKAAIKVKQNRKDVYVIPIIPDLPGKYCIEYPSYDLLTRKFKDFQEYQIKKILNYVDGSIVLTSHMLNELKIGDRPSLVIEAITDFANNLNLIKYKKDKIIVLYTGELSSNVGIKELVEGFKKLEANKYELHICGSGELEKWISTQAARYGNIYYHGFVVGDELKEVEDMADIFINPRNDNNEYTKYSFPSKNLEYLKSGKPVIAYKLSGIPREYDKVLFYPKDNTEEAMLEEIRFISNLTVEEREDIAKRQVAFVRGKTFLVQGKKILNWINKEICFHDEK